MVRDGDDIRDGTGGRNRARALSLILLLLACGLALASPPRSLRFTQLGLGQGLPQESVLAIAQDPQGFVWLGTQTALARFDGYRFTVYRHDRDDACSLSDNWIQALHVDADGALWVGTRTGVDRFDPARGCFEPLGLDGLGAGQHGVHAISADRRGRLWLATPQGLLQVDPGTRRILSTHRQGGDSGLSPGQTGTLAVDAAGDLWVRTPEGLDHLPEGGARFRHFPLTGASRSAAAARFVPDVLLPGRDGELWIGTQAGLYRARHAGGRLEMLSVPAGLVPGDAVHALLFDRAGTLWAGSLRQGLLRLDRDAGAFFAYRHDPGDGGSLADDYVLSLFQDRTGTLWTGTWSGGVSRVDLGSGGFDAYGDSDGSVPRLSDAKVYGISNGPPGVLWLSTRDGGVNRLDVAAGRVEVYRRVPGDPGSLADDGTLVSLEDGRGRLWVATDRGLGHIDLASRRFTAYPLEDGDGPAPLVYCLYRPPRDPDRLWACSRGGLYRIDLGDGSRETFRHDPDDPGSLAVDFVSAVLEDRRGRLWVATVDGGLDRLDPGAAGFAHYRNVPGDRGSLSSNRVQALYEDSRGVLWVGTSVGINRVQEDAGGGLRFRSFTAADGLANDSIGAIREDADGRLWISTTAGLSHFDPERWEVRNYSGNDGLISGSYFVGSAARDADGTLYFGGVNGLTAIGPAGVRGNPEPPQVAITDFQVFNRTVDAAEVPGVSLDAPWPTTRSVRLAPGMSVFTVEFAALHYADPARNLYRYRLQGFDADWVSTDAGRRFATYTNLDPGRYLFEVRAANKDGVWDTQGARLEVVVVPPWWMTWWFRIGGLLLVAAVATWLLRYRIRRLKAEAEALEARVEERTRELEQARSELEQASLTDPLTGMRNRRFLGPQLDADFGLAVRGYARAAAQGREPSPDIDLILMLVDIDHFKRVNDEQGHAAGDEVLVQVHQRLRGAVRASDYLVRWGGEEFLVVVRGSARTSAPRVAEHVRRAFAERGFVLGDGTRLSKTCSIGFVGLPFVRERPEALDWRAALDLADIALYAAKAAGRDGWVGIEAGDGDAVDPAGWSGDLRERLPALLAAGRLRLVTNLDPQRAAAGLGVPG